MASTLVVAAVAEVLEGWTSTPVALPNEQYTPTGVPFVAIEFPGAAVDRLDIGAPAAPLWHEVGVVMVHVFVPLGAGQAQAAAIADAIWELFRGQEVDGVRFDARLSGQAGERTFADNAGAADGGRYWGVSYAIAFRLQAVSA